MESNTRRRVAGTLSAMTWVQGTDFDLPGVSKVAVKAILYSLSAYADEEWSCFPGQKTVALDAGVSVRVVQRFVVEARNAGLLCSQARRLDEGRGRGSDRIYLHVDGRKLFCSCDQPADTAGNSQSLSADSKTTNPPTIPPTNPPSATDSDEHTSLPEPLEPYEPSEASLLLASDWRPSVVAVDAGNLETAATLSAHLAEKLRNRGVRVPPGRERSKGWVEPFEQMIRLDQRDPDKIRIVIDWLDRGEDSIAHFWQANVLSPAKLRLRWDQMAQQVRRDRAARPARHGITISEQGVRDRLDDARRFREERDAFKKARNT